MKNTFTPELKKTKIRKILESLVERVYKTRVSCGIPNNSYSRVYEDVALEEAEAEIQKLIP